MIATTASAREIRLDAEQQFEAAKTIIKASTVTAANCWEFTGHKDNLGYGKIRFAGRSLLAHRLSYAATFSCVPAGLLVCHSCDNPPCVNPSHLFLGSNLDNTMDAVSKNRKFIPDSRGENHGGAKLTAAQVEEIRDLCAKRVISQKQIAARFGIKQPTVSDINTRKHWSHL